MGDYTAKLQKAANPVLEPGERLLAGARGMSAGATARIVGGTAGAVAGGAVGLVLASAVADRASGGDEAGAAGAELPPQIAVGLTDRRLLVFKRGGISGAAKALVAEVPRSHIAEIEGEDSGSKIKPNRLTVRLTDDTSIDFELVTADGFQHLVDAFAGKGG